MATGPASAPELSALDPASMQWHTSPSLLVIGSDAATSMRLVADLLGPAYASAKTFASADVAELQDFVDDRTRLMDAYYERLNAGMSPPSPPIQRPPDVCALFTDLPVDVFARHHRHAPAIRQLFMHNRTLGVAPVWVTSAADPPLPPRMRCCFEYVFLFPETAGGGGAGLDRARVYESYAGMFETVAEFEAAMGAVVRAGGAGACMAIHNGARSNRLEDQVKWYRARERGT